MSIEGEPGWELIAERIEVVLADLEVAARTALAQSRYRPGITALVAQVAGLRAAIDNAARRELMVHAIWDDGYRQGFGLRVPTRKSRPHLTLLHDSDLPPRSGRAED